MPNYKTVFVIQCGHAVKDLGWIPTLAFNDAFEDREDAEAQREQMLKTSSFTRMETEITPIRIIPSSKEPQCTSN